MLVCQHPLTKTRARPQRRKLGHQSGQRGQRGFAPGGCLFVRSEHVCVPLVLFGNDLLELQNLVSLYISTLTFAVF